MHILFHRSFKKQYRKFPNSVQRRFKERIKIFAQHPFDPILHNHALTGEFRGYRSIDVTGDVRALYKRLRADVVEFAFIGTHHELYGK